MSNKNIITIDTIKEYLENNSNSKLISNTYINAKDKLELACSCGEKYYMSWDKIKQSKYKTCIKCANKLSREESRIQNYIKAKKLAKDNGCELLLPECEYRSISQKYKYRCSCGEIFETTVATFKKSIYKSCSKCTALIISEVKEKNGSKISVNDIGNYILQESNCVITNIYGASVDSKIDLICECGEKFHTTFNKFKKSKYKKCRKCSMNSKSKHYIYDYNFVKHEVEKYGVSLLQDNYVNSSEKLKLKCNCGDIFYVSFNRFYKCNQRQCKKCGYKNGSSKQTMELEEFESKVFNILGDKYKVIEYKKASGDVKMEHLVCGKTYTQKGTKILSGQRCSHCYAPVKKDFKEVEDEIISICGQELKLVKYINHDNLILKCKCGNELKRGLSDIRKVRGVFCDKCKSSSGVIQIEKFLNENNIRYIREHSFDDCVYKRKLRFDFYLPNLNMCIEYDGEQHYRVLPHWGGERGFNLNKTRDDIKNKYCKDNGIELLRISFKDSNIDNILKSKIC